MVALRWRPPPPDPDFDPDGEAWFACLAILLVFAIAAVAGAFGG